MQSLAKKKHIKTKWPVTNAWLVPEIRFISSEKFTFEFTITVLCKACLVILVIKMSNDRRNWNVVWKSQPEYKFYCKCHDEQFHFSNPQDDMIEKAGQVAII